MSAHLRCFALSALAGSLLFPTAISQEAYIKASNTGAGDWFGFSVAASGDTVVVGAPNEDTSASDSGAAYVFVRDALGAWSQQAHLKAANAGSGDQFGFSVALSGDTIVIGARGEDSNATGVNGNGSDNSASSSGAAYVFVRSGTTWSQQAYLKASNTGANDGFGAVVAVSGDTAVVTAYWEDSDATGVNGNQNNESAQDSGAAYVFVRSGTSWSQQAYLKPSNTESGDAFGWSVAASADTVVVGSVGEDSSATGVNGNAMSNGALDAGAAYVFVRNGAAWSQQAYLKASNTATEDHFGWSVAVSVNSVVVGAEGEDSSATGVNGDQNDNAADSSGAAYVFRRIGTAWAQQAYLKASNTGPEDSFGSSVSLSGDAAVVGAWQEDGSASNSGAAYSFVRAGAVWSQVAYLKASNPGANDLLGGSGLAGGGGVAVSGDLVVVGGWEEDSNATGVNGNQGDNSAVNSGAAYLFDLDLHPGTSSYGTGTPGCAGPQALGVTHAPMIGSPSFALTCDNAPPSSLGVGIVGDAQDLAGSDPFGLGILFHVDLLSATELLAFDFLSDASGNGRTVASAIPNNPTLVGRTYFAMAAWLWTTCSLPPYNLSASNGVEIVIQP